MISVRVLLQALILKDSAVFVMLLMDGKVNLESIVNATLTLLFNLIKNINAHHVIIFFWAAPNAILSKLFYFKIN